LRQTALRCAWPCNWRSLNSNRACQLHCCLAVHLGGSPAVHGALQQRCSAETIKAAESECEVMMTVHRYRNEAGIAKLVSKTIHTMATCQGKLQIRSVFAKNQGTMFRTLVTKSCDRRASKQKARNLKRFRDYETKTIFPSNTLATAARTRRFSVYWLLQDTIGGDKQGTAKATEAEVQTITRAFTDHRSTILDFRRVLFSRSCVVTTEWVNHLKMQCARSIRNVTSCDDFC